MKARAGTLGIPLLAGRDFDAHDEANWKVAILNRAFAEYYSAGRDPIGQHVTLDHVTAEKEVHTYLVIGLAGNAHYSEISEAPVARTTTLAKQVDTSIFLERTIAALAGAFGATGLVLASCRTVWIVGLYSGPARK